MVRVTSLTFLPIRMILQAVAAFAGRTDRLDDEEVPGHPAPADGVERVLDRDVVVDHQDLDLDPVGLGHLLAHLEGHPVAGVVVDQQQHALGRGESPGRLVHVVHRRGGEDIPRTGGVQHALAHHHDVCGFVTGPGPLDDGDLVRARRVGPHDQVPLGLVPERVGVGQGQSLQHLRNE
jgi:hypothetical protein